MFMFRMLYILAFANLHHPDNNISFPLGMSCSGLPSPLRKHHYVRVGSAALINRMRWAWFDWLRLMPAPDTAADNVFLIKPSFQLWHRCQLCHRWQLSAWARAVASCASCTVDCTAYRAPLIQENRNHLDISLLCMYILIKGGLNYLWFYTKVESISCYFLQSLCINNVTVGTKLPCWNWYLKLQNSTTLTGFKRKEKLKFMS